MADDASVPTSRPVLKKTPTAAYSPTPGCIIFAIGGAALVLFLAWFLYAGWKESQEILGFTDDEARKIEVSADATSALPALEARLLAYAQGIEGKHPSELTLTVLDLNVLLSAHERLASIREHVRINAIEQRVVAAYHVQLNSFPLSSKKRFLNGVIEFTPVIKPSTGLAVQLDNLTVPGKKVAEGFVNLYKEMNFLDDMLLKAFREFPAVGPSLKETTSVTLTPGSVILKFAPK